MYQTGHCTLIFRRCFVGISTGMPKILTNNLFYKTIKTTILNIFVFSVVDPYPIKKLYVMSYTAGCHNS
jgi:hypothetical protein